MASVFDIRNFLAAMSLPEKGDWMEEVIFAELDEEASKEAVKKYNEAGKAAGYGQERRFRMNLHVKSKSVEDS